MQNQIATKTGVREYFASDGKKFIWECDYKRYQNELNTKSALKKIKMSKNVIYHKNLRYFTPPFFPDSYLDISEYINIEYCCHFTPVNKDGIKELGYFLRTIVVSSNRYLNTNYDYRELTEKDIGKMIAVYFDEDLRFIEARDIESFKEELQIYFDGLAKEASLKEE